MKLKINKTFTKNERKKNQMNKDWTEKNKTWQIKIEGLKKIQIKFI
jgi:hypothetical protein